MLTNSTFKSQARLEARLKIPQLPLKLVDEISDIFASRGQTTLEHVGTVLALAQHDFAQIKAFPKIKMREVLADHMLGMTTPEASLSRRQREESMSSTVENLRRHYFGSPEIPFASYDKALGWLSQKATYKNPTYKQLLRLHNDLTAAMRRFPKHIELECSLGHHGISLLDSTAGKKKEGVTFDKGGALEKLRDVTLKMANATGCDAGLCVAHVLTGAPLNLRPINWSVSFSQAYGLKRRQVEIQILEPHAVTLPVISKVLHTIRIRLGLTKKKTITARHERLQRLVDKFGGIPRRGRATFWKKVQRQYNKGLRKGDRPYETWNGPMMAYRRLRSQLNNRSKEGLILHN